MITVDGFTFNNSNVINDEYDIYASGDESGFIQYGFKWLGNNALYLTAAQSESDWYEHEVIMNDIEDIYWYYKAFCFLRDGKAVFQVYLCLDEDGRDYISWLVQMGYNPNMTVGNWEKKIEFDEIEVKMPELIKDGLAELERLQTTERH
jgi:hypothetical protein